MKTKTLHDPGCRVVFFILSILIAYFMLCPSPCRAKTTFTVQIVYGSAICGGVGLFVYFCDSLGSGLLSTDIRPAIVQVRSGEVLWGMPRIGCEHSVLEVPASPSVEFFCVRLVTWEF